MEPSRPQKMLSKAWSCSELARGASFVLRQVKSEASKGGLPTVADFDDATLAREIEEP